MDYKCGPSPIIKVMCFDIARHLCHNKDDRQHFREATKGVKGDVCQCLMWEDAEIRNTMVQATQGFRQARAARMRNTLRPVGWFVLTWM